MAKRTEGNFLPYEVMTITGRDSPRRTPPAPCGCRWIERIGVSHPAGIDHDPEFCGLYEHHDYDGIREAPEDLMGLVRASKGLRPRLGGIFMEDLRLLYGSKSGFRDDADVDLDGARMATIHQLRAVEWPAWVRRAAGNWSEWRRWREKFDASLSVGPDQYTKSWKR